MCERREFAGLSVRRICDDEHHRRRILRQQRPIPLTAVKFDGSRRRVVVQRQAVNRRPRRDGDFSSVINRAVALLTLRCVHSRSVIPGNIINRGGLALATARPPRACMCVYTYARSPPALERKKKGRVEKANDDRYPP